MRSRLLFLLFTLTLTSTATLARAAEPLPPEKAKTAFLKLLDRPKVDAAAVCTAKPDEKDGLIYDHEAFVSEKKATGPKKKDRATPEYVPMLLVRPAKAKGRLR